MVEIVVRVDNKEAKKFWTAVERKALPVATAKTLTFTADRARNRLTQMMPQLFDRPTPFVQRGIQIKPAKPSKLKSTVYVPNSSVEQTLLPHTDLRETSSRKKKKHEYQLAGGYWVVSRNAKTNRYGNLTRATYRRILNDTGQRGPFLRGKGARKTNFFMVGTSPRRMILKRPNTKTRAVPWLIEVGLAVPKYARRRLPFYKITLRMAQLEMPRIFDKTMAREIKKVTP